MRCPFSQLLNIEEPHAANRISSGFALFRLGFRPFFLFGAVFAVVALAYFILLLSGTVEFLPSAWDAVSWHRHEMLFGYAGAIVAGFLFTAVPNWTGHSTPKGTALALVVLLWFAGRVAVFTSSYLPAALVLAVDCSFFLVCAMGIWPALIKSKNQRNYFFVALLALLAFANWLAHGNHANTGITLGLNIIILMMVVIGGRVIPFFTERPLGITIQRNPRIERFTLISTLIALASEVAAAPAALTGTAFLAAAVANGWRFSQWQSVKTLKVPLLWVLHAGYLWLIVGMAMRAVSLVAQDIPATLATHAFTAGGIGVLTLGMMARVSLGHSGRPLAVGKEMTAAFACINLAALLRVFGVWLVPGLAMRWLEMAAGFWIIAFSIFICIYAPILIRPRIDGKDG